MNIPNSNKPFTDKKPKGTFGGYQPNGGRPKGSVNQVSRDFKETIRMLLEANSVNVAIWLERVAEENPAKALELLSRLAEFAVPRLKSVELSGDKDNPLRIEEIKRLVIDPLVIDQAMPVKKDE